MEIKTVYLVYATEDNPYGDNYLDEVFDSEEEAEKYVKAKSMLRDGNRYTIDEKEVKVRLTQKDFMKVMGEVLMDYERDVETLQALFNDLEVVHKEDLKEIKDTIEDLFTSIRSDQNTLSELTKEIDC